MDVVAKEGSLFLQGVKFGKRIWRKTWVILFEPTAMGIGRIEMYDMRDGGGGTKPAGLKKADKRVVRLTDCLSITPAPGESCPTGCAAFYLNTTQRTYTLANPMQDEWVPTLCQLAFQKSEVGGDPRRAQRDDDTSMSENDLYSTWSPGKFQVTVQKSEASVRCCMSGLYLLSPEKEALCLLDLRTGKTVFYWPYRFLRRFGQIKEGITIEAGRRCETGEGHFAFLSKQGAQIYRAIEEAIMHQSVQELLSKATAESKESTIQKPPARPAISDLSKGPQGSPTRGVHDRPYPVPSRRNLALPAPPVPTPPAPLTTPAPPAPPAPPASPAIMNKPSAIVAKRFAVRTKPLPSTSKPQMSASNLPTSASKPQMSASNLPSSASKPLMSTSNLPTSASKPQMSASNLLTSASKPQMSASNHSTSASKPLTSTSTNEEVVYATIQLHPKPSVKPTPPKIPQLPVAPNYSPPQPEQKWEPQKEIKDCNSYISDEDPDSDYCNWKQGSERCQDSPNIEEVYSIAVPPPRHKTKHSMEISKDQAEPSHNIQEVYSIVVPPPRQGTKHRMEISKDQAEPSHNIQEVYSIVVPPPRQGTKHSMEISQDQAEPSHNIQEVYSIVVPPPRQGTKHSMEISQDQAEPSHNSSASSSSDMPVNFKQMLSNVLFKDLSRITPPRSYGGSSDHLAKLDMDDMDYCETQK